VRPRRRVAIAAGLLVYGACAACTRPSSSVVAPPPDAAGARVISVRVPAALRIERGLDTLSVSIDEASLAPTDVTADPGMVLGVQTDVYVFPQGQPRPSTGRHGLASSTDFAAGFGVDTWNTAQNGVPAPGKRHVVEMDLVLFETDVAPGHEWDPHAGKYKPLWTRTLRQAEE
jgi:hypothetical protein